MSSYPWGPHGPQSGPNQVTPNPTPAYVPPPPQPTYYPPQAPTAGNYGGSPAPNAYTGPVTPSGPHLKHYWIALALTFIFGPLGLFYASKKGALMVLFLLVAAPVCLGVIGVLPGGSPAQPFAILSHDGVMNRMWSYSVALSMLWSVLAVSSYNSNAKANF